jgi:hypothetical protein
MPEMPTLHLAVRFIAKTMISNGLTHVKSTALAKTDSTANNAKLHHYPLLCFGSRFQARIRVVKYSQDSSLRIPQGGCYEFNS